MSALAALRIQETPGAARMAALVGPIAVVTGEEIAEAINLVHKKLNGTSQARRNSSIAAQMHSSTSRAI